MGAQIAVNEVLMSFLADPGRAPLRVDDAARIETTTLLPGGGVVTLSLRLGGGGYVVSDDGAARLTLMELGIQDLSRGDIRTGNEIARTRGLVFDGNRFSASEVADDQLASAVAYVADASREWASAAIAARARKRERNLVERVVSRLQAIAPGLQFETEREVQGASTKRHRFDLVVSLPGDRFALFETLTPAAVSLAAAHMKFYDLLQAHRDWPREAVVEDLSIWPSDDLALMQQVSSHIRALDSSWADLATLAA
jgi:hypothetical protein